MKKTVLVVFSVILVSCYGDDEPGSYSFYRFSGPVSGKVHEIQVPSSINPYQKEVDYVARPDYSFNFEVHDPEFGNSQTRSESRDGDNVQGEYSVIQSDGVKRIVRYNADPDSGFQAVVEYI